jgi:tungstate transport system ATP-binding protein
MSAETLFELRGIGFAYQEREVLDLPDLELAAGEVTVIAGRNGSGKTTLLKLLNCLLEPGRGEILYRGLPVQDRNRQALRRETVHLHQNPYLFEGTVAQNLGFPLQFRGTSRREQRRIVAETLALTGLSSLAQRAAHRLSGGEKQRVALARALVLAPRVLLLDEPTANIDPASLRDLEALLSDLSSRGITLIMSSHHTGFAYRLADRLIELKEGRLAPSLQNIFKGEVAKREAGFLYFRIAGDRGLLRCPDREGKFTSVVLDQDDVILSPKELETSAQNRLAGTVTAVERRNHTVVVALDCGFPIRALITEYSLETLDIRRGTRLYVTFKASALRLY